MSALPASARDLLAEGVLCHLAAPAPAGPHVTPVVYVLDGDRLWGTTGRRTAKAARWRREPVAGGLVRVGGRALTFRGPVTLYDALDPSTWPHSLARAPQVAGASARFMLKNARFFAGYTRDVALLPLAWTPPARVIFSVDLEAGAVIEGDAIGDRWGTWGRRVAGQRSYRRIAGELSPSELPQSVRDLVGRSGHGTLGLPGRNGPAVLPVRWARSGETYLALLPRRVLALAGTYPDQAGSLVVDHASSWRASRMRGVLLRGDASVFVPSAVDRGGSALNAAVAAAGGVPDDPAVVRLRPRTAVWWVGWSSGTVRPR